MRKLNCHVCDGCRKVIDNGAVRFLRKTKKGKMEHCSVGCMVEHAPASWKGLFQVRHRNIPEHNKYLKLIRKVAQELPSKT